ncbi:MAG: hypothetical protein Dasosvirus5_6 [Dasosvirus sp.]|uniref:Peptidase C14 caspase domain-containing protein n=1 Tax=Dasosvirus sp. TaxID=2487764 RepID=A0A3G4ZRK7_9VIRU|nr:MAG: hypothetical protein Dasosvirus5_6 [Dasosvirus sp.]
MSIPKTYEINETIVSKLSSSMQEDTFKLNIKTKGYYNFEFTNNSGLLIVVNNSIHLKKSSSLFLKSGSILVHVSTTNFPTECKLTVIAVNNKITVENTTASNTTASNTTASNTTASNTTASNTTASNTTASNTAINNIASGTTTSNIATETSVETTSQKKYAIVVGISDYLYINDLSFCDEDATDWCRFFEGENYTVTLLGDKTSKYGNYDESAYATEKNIRQAIYKVANLVKDGDHVVFVSSGHGGQESDGSVYICCLNVNNGPDGKYIGSEFANDFKKITDKGATVIISFDNCHSGGLLDQIIQYNPSKICAISTCGRDGYGWDVSQYSHGAWTYDFLDQTIIPNYASGNRFTVGEAFTQALKRYPYTGSNTPQIKGNDKLKI